MVCSEGRWDELWKGDIANDGAVAPVQGNRGSIGNKSRNPLRAVWQRIPDHSPSIPVRSRVGSTDSPITGGKGRGDTQPPITGGKRRENSHPPIAAGRRKEDSRHRIMGDRRRRPRPPIPGDSRSVLRGKRYPGPRPARALRIVQGRIVAVHSPWGCCPHPCPISCPGTAPEI